MVFSQWFTALDVNFGRKFLLAGDNSGFAWMYDLNGNGKGSFRLHKGKIHHIEFSKK
jgi:hypothetical protein